MIESQVLGGAVGIQRNPTVDKTETSVLPSVNNGVIVGKFKRGRMDKAFRVTKDNYRAILGYEPNNPSYMAVEDAFATGISQLFIVRVGDSAGKVIAPVKLNPINWIRRDTQTGVSNFYNCTGEYITDKTEHDLNTKVWTDGSFIPNVGETYRIYLPNAPYVLYLSQATHAYVGQVVEGDPSPRSSNFCYVIYDDSKHTYGCKSAQFSNNPSEIGQNIGKYSVAAFDDEHQLRDGDYIELKYLGVDEETKLPQIQITHPAGLNTTTDIILFYPERKYLNVSLESPANKSGTSSYYPIVPLRVAGVNTDFTPLYDACT